MGTTVTAAFRRANSSAAVPAVGALAGMDRALGVGLLDHQGSAEPGATIAEQSSPGASALDPSLCVLGYRCTKLRANQEFRIGKSKWFHQIVLTAALLLLFIPVPTLTGWFLPQRLHFLVAVGAIMQATSRKIRP